MKALINGTVMPIVFNGSNIVVALDPENNGDDQRTVFLKDDTNIQFFNRVKRGGSRRPRMGRFMPIIPS